ncbi:permease prefix domain 1-containing protein [Agrococcus versicolor]|uniref:Permease prefix domain 1-containing protein n=1 Tax=Agrococcus versicolor TaxID=501482 RepID=A0ABP5MLA1_9MICO
MSDTTLTQRYVAAVVRSVPEDARTDVAAELEASIHDQVDARIDAGEPTTDAERAVLVELGDPAALAASYAGRPLTLVGPRVYLQWRRTLVMLLWIVVPLGTIGAVLIDALTGEAAGTIIATGITTLMQIGLHVAFWTTLAFAVVDRAGAATPMQPWTPERLPRLVPRGGTAGETIASAVTIAIAIGALLWDRLVGFVVLDGEAGPALTSSPLVLVLLVAVLVAQSAPQLAASRSGAWTRRIAVANAIVSLATGTLLVGLVAAGLVLSERLADRLETWGVAPVAGAIAIVVLVVGTAWNVVDGFLRARKAQRA